MPDITMCRPIECIKKDRCYRYTAEPSQYRQSYAHFGPGDDGLCAEYWPISQDEGNSDEQPRRIGLNMDASTHPTDDEIDAAINRWHVSASENQLHDFLGWSRNEFDAWVVDPTKAPKRPLP